MESWLEFGKALGGPLLIAFITLVYYFKLSNSLIEVIKANTSAMESAAGKLDETNDLITVVKANTTAMEKVGYGMENFSRRVESLEREVRQKQE